MALAEALASLAELHAKGALSDEEFARAKARLLGGGDAASAGAAGEPLTTLRRTGGDRWLGGVCGGLARSTGLEAWAWRLMFTALFLFAGAGLLVYLLLWIFVPGDGQSR